MTIRSKALAGTLPTVLNVATGMLSASLASEGGRDRPRDERVGRVETDRRGRASCRGGRAGDRVRREADRPGCAEGHGWSSDSPLKCDGRGGVACLPQWMLRRS